MVTTMVPDVQARLRSMDHVREMFGPAPLPLGFAAGSPGAVGAPR